MPFTDATLAQAVTAMIDAALTVHLHTGDPGSAGTDDRVATSVVGSASISGTSAWTTSDNGRTATLDDDLDFGTAAAAATGVSWISIFEGTTLWATRELAAAMDIAVGAEVAITGSTVSLTLTSTDS